MSRWQGLFDDLESQLEQELAAEELDLRAEEERLRIGRLTLRDRVRAMSGAPLSVGLRDGTLVGITVEAVGRDWMAGSTGAGSRSSAIVPFAAISMLVLPEGPDAPLPRESPGELSARLGLAFALRDLCRRRVAVDLRTVDGGWHGTIDRVGRDHLDLAEHPDDSPRRAGAVLRTRVLPFAGIVLVGF
jgi:hypothetical protein